jgi:hypothetical protein
MVYLEECTSSKNRHISYVGPSTGFIQNDVVRRGGGEKGELIGAYNSNPLSNLDSASSMFMSSFALMLNIVKKQSLLRSRASKSKDGVARHLFLLFFIVLARSRLNNIKCESRLRYSRLWKDWRRRERGAYNSRLRHGAMLDSSY